MNRDKIWHLLSRKLTGEASDEELFELQQYEKAREYKIDMFKQRLEIGLDLWTGLRLDKSIDVKEGMCPSDEEDWF